MVRAAAARQEAACLGNLLSGRAAGKPCADAAPASAASTQYGARQQATASVPAGNALMPLPLGIERIRHRTADRFGQTDSIPMVATVTFVSWGVVALMMRERH